MASNLRDRGYPSSVTTTRSAGQQPRVARQLSGTATGLNKGASTNSTPKVEVDQLYNDNAQKVGTLINAMMKAKNIPVEVNGQTNLFSPDYNWGKWTDTTYSARTPDGTRLGFANKYHDFNPSGMNGYSVGVDNLYGLGDDYVNKEYNLPLGITASMEYDGDGTLSGSLEVPQRNYYLQALANLLRR